jgi:hypothetical protein
MAREDPEGRPMTRVMDSKEGGFYAGVTALPIRACTALSHAAREMIGGNSQLPMIAKLS